MNQQKFKKSQNFDKLMKQLCKERGWNVNELTTGQALFIMSQIKKSKYN